MGKKNDQEFEAIASCLESILFSLEALIARVELLERNSKPPKDRLPENPMIPRRRYDEIDYFRRPRVKD